MRRLATILTLLAAAGAPSAAASDGPPSQADLEDEIVCPTCKTTLDQSNAPVAQRMKAYIAARIRAGDSKGEIKDQLVDQFGRAVLAEPPAEGFDLLAWLLPLGGLGLAAVAVGVLAWRWTRVREPADGVAAPDTDGRAPLDPELERRLDAELARFDG